MGDPTAGLALTVLVLDGFFRGSVPARDGVHLFFDTLLAAGLARVASGEAQAGDDARAGDDGGPSCGVLSVSIVEEVTGELEPEQEMELGEREVQALLRFM